MPSIAQLEERKTVMVQFADLDVAGSIPARRIYVFLIIQGLLQLRDTNFQDHTRFCKMDSKVLHDGGRRIITVITWFLRLINSMIGQDMNNKYWSEGVYICMSRNNII